MDQPTDVVKSIGVQPDVAPPGFTSRASAIAATQVSLFENHDQALSVWQRAGVADRILVHIDPHHDLWWVPPDKDVSFANYICRALTEGIAREVFWVVPGQSWSSAVNRRAILHQVRRILRAYPGGGAAYEFGRDRVRAKVLGKRLEVCSLASLPEFHEPVLLDIDVDFFVLPRVSDGPPNEHGSLPCRWPQEFVGQIGKRRLQWDLATIAYSVEGGYTPLRWKYLGDEVALRLQGYSPANDVRLGAMAHLRSGAEAENRGELADAAAEYGRAHTLWPESAAPLLCLALLSQRLGDLDEARRLYDEALERDSSYRTVYNSEGLWHFWDGRHDEAEMEFRRALEIDPDNTTSLVGLAWLAMKRKKWDTAASLIHEAVGIDVRRDEAALKRVRQRDSLQLDIYRALGEILRHQGKHGESIAAFERSLRLAHAGEQSHKRPIIAYSGEARLMDADHWAIFARVGQLYKSIGDKKAARQRYRIALAGGYDSVSLRFQLLRLASGFRGEFGIVNQSRHCAKQVLRVGVRYIRGQIGRPSMRWYETWRAS